MSNKWYLHVLHCSLAPFLSEFLHTVTSFQIFVTYNLIIITLLCCSLRESILSLTEHDDKQVNIFTGQLEKKKHALEFLLFDVSFLLLISWITLC